MLSNGNDSNTTKLSEETKLCYIEKRSDFDGYGFNLHSQKIKPGQFIGEVDINSPAFLAGLKEGDQIIEVNGVRIGNETHKQVVKRIRAFSNEVRLLLIDVDAAKQKEGAGAPTEEEAATVVARTTSESKAEEERNCMPSNNDEKYDGNVQENTESTNSRINNNTTPSPSPMCADTSQIVVTDPIKMLSNNNKAGSLELPITAAEMRAKLMSKKKNNPKNENVDLKKKFEIIQKL